MRLLSTESPDSTTAYTRLSETSGESKADTADKQATTVVSIREDLVEDVDALHVLAQHYLIQSHPHSIRYRVFKSVLLATASLSSERIEGMVLGIELSDGEKLQKSLAAQPVLQRQLLLGGMDEKEFKRLDAHEENLIKKINGSSACGLAVFYGKREFLSHRPRTSPSVEMKVVQSSAVNTTPTVSTTSTAIRSD